MFSGRMVLQLVLPIILILEVATAAPVPDPNCPTSCGDIGIPYPFGIGSSCSRDEWFTVTCNDSMNYNPRRFVPFLSSINLEILEITPENGTLLVRAPRISSNCPDGTDPGWYVNLTDSPFSFSDTRNVFAAIGCNTVALVPKLLAVQGKIHPTLVPYADAFEHFHIGLPKPSTEVGRTSGEKKKKVGGKLVQKKIG